MDGQNPRIRHRPAAAAVLPSVPSAAGLGSEIQDQLSGDSLPVTCRRLLLPRYVSVDVNVTDIMYSLAVGNRANDIAGGCMNLCCFGVF